MKVSKAASLMTGVIEKEIVKDADICGAFLDSRLVTENSLFFASKGVASDGNLYAADSLKKGAAAIIMTDRGIYRHTDGNKILVEDSLETMKRFGALRLKNNVGKKIAVTGSFGKTGTKEMLKHIFAANGTVYATVGNKNNELGLALTAAGIDDGAKYIILEMGTSNPGEIQSLSETAHPDTAVVVSVGLAHVGRFGGLENIIHEKLSIACGLKKGGTLIIPESLREKAPKGDYKMVTFGSGGDFYITNLIHEGMDTVFEINKGGGKYRIKHPYEHLAQNALAAIAAAYEYGLTYDEIKCGLENFTLPIGHGNIETAGGLTIINDAYNGGFESFIRAAESLHETSFQDKYAIFGELGEIDGFESEIYKKIGSLAEIYTDVEFYLCGESYGFLKPLKNRKILSSKAECAQAVKVIKNGAALVKASNAYNFNEIVESLKKTAGSDAL